MFPFVISSLLRVLSFKRICPMCKKGQIVSSDQKRKSVKCKFCGATMPAPSANWRPHTQPDLIPWTAQWPPSYLFNEATRDRRHGAVFFVLGRKRIWLWARLTERQCLRHLSVCANLLIPNKRSIHSPAKQKAKTFVKALAWFNVTSRCGKGSRGRFH